MESIDAKSATKDSNEEEVVIIGQKVLCDLADNQLIDVEEESRRRTGGQRRTVHSYKQRNRNTTGVEPNRSYVQTLNEMFPNQTRYVEEGRMGPQHEPQFRIAVHVSGLTFHGISRSKQMARHEAAKQAIHYLCRNGRQTGSRGYGQRYHNRFDNYHRSEPYYRFQTRDPLPPLRPEPQMHYRGRPYEPYFDPQLDYYNDYSSEPQPQPQYEDYYYDSPNYRESWPTGAPQTRPNAQPVPPVGLESALETFVTTPLDRDLAVNAIIETKGKSIDDFTSDEYCDDSFIEFNEKSGNKSDDELEDMRTEDTNAEIISNNNSKSERIILRVMSQTPVNQNPVSLIHELQPNAKWVCTELNTQTKKHSTTFKMTLLLPLANQCFTGNARTKKLAKAEAASKALLQMYNISISAQNCENPELIKPKSTVSIAQEPLLLKQEIADRIGRQVMTKCNEVWDKMIELKKWTVLSAIVLTDETNVDFVEVICLTSGTKCVKGDSLSMNGYALNDCHAEVLARRSFVHYIYSQIDKLIDNNFEDKPEFIVEKRPNSQGFRIKTNIKVNLFISTAPCGDSRVFSPKEEVFGLTQNLLTHLSDSDLIVKEGDAHPNRQTRGLLRAKIEGGEGTIPVKRDAILTWDGILQGHQRLQFMSCSDKIAVWNVVGIQGALLSHLMEPIYLNAVVLASLFNYEHLVRALHGRLNLNFDSNSLKALPENFAFNKSKVAKCQLKEDITRQLTKAPNYALNWIIGDERPEVVSTENGRIHIENSISRLSKRSLFAKFCSLLGRNTPTLPTCPLGQNIPVIYREGKTASVDYQRAKTQCMQTFQEQNVGNWIQVPSEIDLFRL